MVLALPPTKTLAPDHRVIPLHFGLGRWVALHQVQVDAHGQTDSGKFGLRPPRIASCVLVHGVMKVGGRHSK
jgi:hypothetical protein